APRHRGEARGAARLPLARERLRRLGGVGVVWQQPLHPVGLAAGTGDRRRRRLLPGVGLERARRARVHDPASSLAAGLPPRRDPPRPPTPRLLRAPPLPPPRG